MLKFVNYNANPKGRKTGDCSTRALCTTLDLTYNQVLWEQLEACKSTGYAMESREAIEKIMLDYGFVKMKQPRKMDNSKYKVKELDTLLTDYTLSKGVLVVVANHCTCIKNRNILDIWDCGDKCVGNYYISSECLWCIDKGQIAKR